MSKILKAVVFVCAVVIVTAAPAFAGTTVTVVVPEPASIMMLAGGIGAVAGLRYYMLRKR